MSQKFKPTIIILFIAVPSFIAGVFFSDNIKALFRNSVKITADALYSEYQKDEIRADVNYKGKLLEVDGIVSNFGKNFAGNAFVSLDGHINCTLLIEADAINLKLGQRIVLKGILVEPTSKDPELHDCKLIR